MGTIADKLTYLNTTKGKIKDSINLTGANIGNSDTFRSYSAKLRDGLVGVLNDGGKTLYNNFPKVTATGSSATLNSTYQAPMRVGLKGNTYQDSVPTPSSPQNIEVVTGNNTIKVQNKNLFDNEKITRGSAYSYGTTGSVPTSSGSNARATISPTNSIKVLPSTTYTLSFPISGFRYALGQMDSGYISLGDSGWKTNTTYSFTTNATTNYIGFNFSKTDNSAISDSEWETLKNGTIQLEKSSTATSYIEHQEQVYPINLGDLELCKIGDYQDYIYNQNGDWYLHKEIGKVILNGSSNEDYIYQNNNRFWLERTYWSDETVPFNPPQNTLQGLYCNRFVERTRTQTWVGTEGISYDNSNTTKEPIGSTFDIACNSLATNVTNFKNWLSNNNLVIYYILQNTTDTQITDTTLINQLNALEKAKSYTGVTNITAEYVSGNQPLMMDVSALLKEE